jgi:hypothetical protein
LKTRCVRSLQSVSLVEDRGGNEAKDQSKGASHLTGSTGGNAAGSRVGASLRGSLGGVSGIGSRLTSFGGRARHGERLRAKGCVARS